MSRRGAWQLVKALVTCGLLAAVFTRIEFHELAAVLARMRVGPLLWGMGLSTLARYLGAHQMQRVMSVVGMHFGIWQVVAVNLSAAFYEIVVPGAHFSGGLVRLHRFTRGAGQVTEALAAILFNRFLDTLTLVVLGLAFWAIGNPGGPHGAAIGITLAVLLAALLAFHLEVKHRQLSSAAARWPLLQALWRAVPQRLRDAVQRPVEQTTQAYRRFRLAHAAMLPVAGLSLTRHLLFIGSMACFAHALDLQVPWPVFGWTRTVVVLLMMLPISIGGFGVREGSLVVLFAPFGVPAADAVALSLVMFASGLVFGVAGGLMELTYALGAGRKARSEKASP